MKLIIFVFVLLLVGCGKDVTIAPAINGPSIKDIIQGDCPDGTVIENIGSICLCVSPNEVTDCPSNN